VLDYAGFHQFFEYMLNHCIILSAFKRKEISHQCGKCALNQYIYV